MKVVGLFFALLVTFAVSSCVPGGPEAKVTINVVDEAGSPVEGALVAVLGFTREREGKTDKLGRFTATIRNATSKIEVVIRKKGYYSISRHIYEYTGGYDDYRWKPWNPRLDFILPKKRNPVVLRQKYVHGVDIPLKGQPVGYDLLAGDWVAPAGKGRINDFILLAQPTSTNGNFTTNRLVLTFSNSGDGLIQTNIHWRNDYTLRLPPMAPRTGYSNAWTLYLNEYKDPQSGIVHVQSNSSQDNNYYFRIRTTKDSTGEIQSAIYGKIYRGILYGPSRAPDDLPSIEFDYYLNPDGTRNLESEGERPDDDDP